MDSAPPKLEKGFQVCFAVSGSWLEHSSWIRTSTQICWIKSGSVRGTVQNLVGNLQVKKRTYKFTVTAVKCFVLCCAHTCPWLNRKLQGVLSDADANTWDAHGRRPLHDLCHVAGATAAAAAAAAASIARVCVCV